MLQCHATYHAWHGTHNFETLAHRTRLAHTQTWERGRLDWLEQLFQKTAFSPV